MDNLLYSKRKKLIEKGNQPDVYQYDRLPIKFRRQVVHIWRNTISAYESCIPNSWWDSLHNYFIRELGEFQLGQDRQASASTQCFYFVLDETAPIDNVLDLIEITFQCIDIDIRKAIQGYHFFPNARSRMQHPTDAINELNHRFREYSIGYQYNNG
jgi:hypothetical protein